MEISYNDVQSTDSERSGGDLLSSLDGETVEIDQNFSSGDMLTGRYKTVYKLGVGTFSTVWRCQDVIDGRYVAVKVVKSDLSSTQDAKHEIKMLQEIRRKAKCDPIGNKLLVTFLDHFQFCGNTGTNICLVQEVCGNNLLTFLQSDCKRGMLIPNVKLMISQVVRGLQFLHTICGIIHNDIKPENILISGNWQVNSLVEAFSKNLTVKIANFGCACKLTEITTGVIQTRQYRAPEVLLLAKSSQKVDIWSVGCLAFELATGDYLFDPYSNDDKWNKDEDHLALIIELFGTISKEVINLGQNYKRYFSKSGKLRNIKTFNFWPLDKVLGQKYKWNIMDAVSFSNWLLPMLQVNPYMRETAEECLDHTDTFPLKQVMNNINDPMKIVKVNLYNIPVEWNENLNTFTSTSKDVQNSNNTVITLDQIQDRQEKKPRLEVSVQDTIEEIIYITKSVLKDIEQSDIQDPKSEILNKDDSVKVNFCEEGVVKLSFCDDGGVDNILDMNNNVDVETVDQTLNQLNMTSCSVLLDKINLQNCVVEPDECSPWSKDIGKGDCVVKEYAEEDSEKRDTNDQNLNQIKSEVFVNCKTCKHCLDMPKYGGPGKFKKPCKLKPKREYAEEDSEKQDTNDQNLNQIKSEVIVNCKTCKHCLDMRKYGGPGKFRQRCKLKPKRVKRKTTTLRT